MSLTDLNPEQLYYFKLFLGLVFVFGGLWREGILYFYLFPDLLAYGQYTVEITAIYVVLTGLVRFWRVLFGMIPGVEREK